MEKEKSNKGVITILVIIIIILLALVVLFATGTISFKKDIVNDNHLTNENNIEQQNNDENGNQDNLTSQNELGSNDTFTTANNSGIVEVMGYVKIEEKEVPSMYENAGEKYKYVYFYITETKSNEFKKYLESLEGNAFVSDNAIGLGCTKDGKITYYNSSDELGEKSYELSQEVSNKILNSSESNLVKLKLEKLAYSSGKGATSCFSHITYVEVK